MSSATPPPLESPLLRPLNDSETRRSLSAEEDEAYRKAIADATGVEGAVFAVEGLRERNVLFAERGGLIGACCITCVCDLGRGLMCNSPWCAHVGTASDDQGLLILRLGPS